MNSRFILSFVSASLLLVLAIAACGGAATVTPVKTGEAAAANRQPKNPNEVMQIECGDFHSCALLGSGAVKCWGRNTHGTLGDVGPEDHLKPTRVPGLAPLKQIGLGATFSCGLTEDGRVQCWGTGRIFRDGKMVERAKPAFVPGLSNVSELAVSGVLICARTDAGDVTCWGTEKEVPLPFKNNVAEVAVASAHICARTEQEIGCSGDDALGKVPTLKNERAAKQLVSGDAFACVLDTSGAASCWGQNTMGQLGRASDMSAHDKPLPIQGLGPIERLAAGESQACAITANGSVSCWGNNSDGELGIGTISDTEKPTRMKLSEPVKEVCLASMHGCARAQSGKVYCWGDNSGGQLGDGTETARPTPTEVNF